MKTIARSVSSTNGPALKPVIIAWLVALSLHAPSLHAGVGTGALTAWSAATPDIAFDPVNKALVVLGNSGQPTYIVCFETYSPYTLYFVPFTTAANPCNSTSRSPSGSYLLEEEIFAYVASLAKASPSSIWPSVLNQGGTYLVDLALSNKESTSQLTIGYPNSGQKQTDASGFTYDFSGQGESQERVAALNHLFNSANYLYNTAPRAVAHVNRIVNGKIWLNLTNVVSATQVGNLLSDNPYNCSSYSGYSSAYPINFGFLVSRFLDADTYALVLGQGNTLAGLALQLKVADELGRKNGTSAASSSYYYATPARILYQRDSTQAFTNNASYIANGFTRVLEHQYSSYYIYGTQNHGDFYMSFDQTEFGVPGYKNSTNADPVVEPLDWKENAREIIYTLYNGMHAYFLSNNLGARQTEAPASIVRNRFNLGSLGGNAVYPSVRPGKKASIEIRDCFTCHAGSMYGGPNALTKTSQILKDRYSSVLGNLLLSNAFYPLNSYDFAKAIAIYQGGEQNYGTYASNTSTLLVSAIKKSGGFIQSPSGSGPVPILPDINVRYSLDTVTATTPESGVSLQELALETGATLAQVETAAKRTDFQTLFYPGGTDADSSIDGGSASIPRIRVEQSFCRLLKMIP